MFNAEDTKVGLTNFLAWKMKAERQLGEWTKEVVLSSPVDLDQLLDKCRRLNEVIRSETDSLAFEMATKNEDALAHLMCHWVAIGPNYICDKPGGRDVEAKKLRDEEVAEFERIFDITKEFLIKVGRM